MSPQGPPPDYVEVSERIAEFREKHPDGSLQAEIVPSPVEGFVVVKAYAYRTPDDQRPGVGLAWEPVPGKTNFTRDSELMNAETSAWGRALIAVGAADAKRGIASANEVRNRQAAKKTTRKKTAKQRSEDEMQQVSSDEVRSLVKTRLEQAGIPGDFFAAWLHDTYGVERLAELSDEQRTEVVHGLTQGDLLERLGDAA
jgi:hypothetical protein